MQGDEARMRPLAKRYFDSGIYSETILRYSYNELAGMDEDGIYIANGDAAIIPKWLIQEGMGKHKDKTIVCMPFLAVKEYRDWLCRKLDIVDPIHEEPYWTDESCRALLQTIIDRYGTDRVLFGTDYPLGSPAEELARFLSLGYSDAEYRQMLSENARKVFRLDTEERSVHHA